MDQLLEKALMLAEQPLMGRLRPELAPQIRSLPVKAYMLYYRPIEGGIELVRVLNSARDIDSIRLTIFRTLTRCDGGVSDYLWTI
ncbi:type II toxin-antitoxin system RelE/ParE family toxin [Asticcacaulis taihuensis]|uniref:type II toxin-antitoxin system RelE/ParE family toxin n=1 Tax=Asticcacaulis taihuensis TaxID=260084 RepID=UPI003F7CC28A